MKQPDLDTRLPLFVYGTLLPGEANHERFLAGRWLSCVAAATAGELWWAVAEDYPYLLPGRNRVSGCLVTLAPAGYAATLAAIDRLEDFYPGREEDCLYLRRVITVELADGTRVPAWTYLWNSSARPGMRLVNGDFRDRPR